MGKIRRQRFVFIVGATLAACAVAAGTVWVSSAAAARAKVEVLIDVNAFSCANPKDVTANVVALGDDDATYTVPALNITKNLDCTFSFIVHNAGDTDIGLNGLTIQLAGAGNANGVTMHRLTRNAIEPTAGDDADAHFMLDDSLSAGDAIRFSAVVGSTPGCVGDGGSITTVNSPTVRVSALGLSGDVSLKGPAYSLMGTAESSCDE